MNSGYTISSLGGAGYANPRQITIDPGGVGVSTPGGVLSILGITYLFPDLSELYIYGRTCDPGMEHCSPRLRRNLQCTSANQ